MNTATMSQGGRVVVPKQYREKLVAPFHMVNVYVRGDSLADELIAERRTEATCEDGA